MNEVEKAIKKFSEGEELTELEREFVVFVAMGVLFRIAQKIANPTEKDEEERND